MVLMVATVNVDPSSINVEAVEIQFDSVATLTLEVIAKSNDDTYGIQIAASDPEVLQRTISSQLQLVDSTYAVVAITKVTATIIRVSGTPTPTQ